MILQKHKDFFFYQEYELTQQTIDGEIKTLLHTWIPDKLWSEL